MGVGVGVRGVLYMETVVGWGGNWRARDAPVLCCWTVLFPNNLIYTLFKTYLKSIRGVKKGFVYLVIIKK